MILGNHEQLMAAINQDLEKVVDEVAAQVQETVKSHVWKVVYAPYQDMVRSYHRREEEGGFLGSWTYDLLYGDSGDILAKIYSSPEDDFMELNTEDHVHGAPGNQDEGLFGPEIDRREELDLLIATGKGYDFYVNPKSPNYLGDGVDNWWTRPRDYFSPTLEELSMGGFDKFAKISMKNFGLNIKEG
jgi:hypothetical protein